jgi:hypothetical protein
MNIQRETYFAIEAEDKPGTLALITATLMEEGVDMSGVWGFGLGDGSAKVMAVPRSIPAFKKVAKAAGWNINEHICFHLEGDDRPGALVEILHKISSEGLNLNAVDAIGVEGQFGCYIWSNDDDVIPISEILGLRTPLI